MIARLCFVVLLIAVGLVDWCFGEYAVSIPTVWNVFGPLELNKNEPDDAVFSYDVTNLQDDNEQTLMGSQGPISWIRLNVSRSGKIPKPQSHWSSNSVYWAAAEYNFEHSGLYELTLDNPRAAAFLSIRVYDGKLDEFVMLEDPKRIERHVFIPYTSDEHSVKYIVYIKQSYADKECVPPTFVKTYTDRDIGGKLDLLQDDVVFPDIVLQNSQFPEEPFVFAGEWFGIGLENNLRTDVWSEVARSVQVTFFSTSDDKELFSYSVPSSKLAHIVSGQIGQLVLPIPPHVRSAPQLQGVLKHPGACLAVSVELIHAKTQVVLSSALFEAYCRVADSRFSFTFRPGPDETNSYASPAVYKAEAMLPLKPISEGLSCQVPGNRLSRGCGLVLATDFEAVLEPSLYSWILFIPPNFISVEQVIACREYLASKLPGVPSRLKLVLRISPFNTIAYGRRALEFGVRFPDATLAVIATSSTVLDVDDELVELLSNLNPYRVAFQNLAHPAMSVYARRLTSHFHLEAPPMTFTNPNQVIRHFEVMEPELPRKFTFTVSDPATFGSFGCFKVGAKLSPDALASIEISRRSDLSWTVLTRNVRILVSVFPKGNAVLPFFELPNVGRIAAAGFSSHLFVHLRIMDMVCVVLNKGTWQETSCRFRDVGAKTQLFGGVSDVLSSVMPPIIVYPTLADTSTRIYRTLATSLANDLRLQTGQFATILSDKAIVQARTTAGRNLIVLGGYGVNRLCDSTLSCRLAASYSEQGALSLSLASSSWTLCGNSRRLMPLANVHALQTNESCHRARDMNRAMFGYGAVYSPSFEYPFLVRKNVNFVTLNSRESVSARYPPLDVVLNPKKFQIFYSSLSEDEDNSLYLNTASGKLAASKGFSKDADSYGLYKWSRAKYLNRGYWSHKIARKLRTLLGEDGKQTGYMRADNNNSSMSNLPFGYMDGSKQAALNRVPSEKLIRNHKSGGCTVEASLSESDDPTHSGVCYKVAVNDGASTVDDGRRLSKMLGSTRAGLSSGVAISKGIPDSFVDWVDDAPSDLNEDSGIDDETLSSVQQFASEPGNAGDGAYANRDNSADELGAKSRLCDVFTESADARLEKLDMDDRRLVSGTDSAEKNIVSRILDAASPQDAEVIDSPADNWDDCSSSADDASCAAPASSQESKVTEGPHAADSIESEETAFKKPNNAATGVARSNEQPKAPQGNAPKPQHKKGKSKKLKSSKRVYKRALIDYVPKRFRHSALDYLREFTDRTLMSFDVENEIARLEEAQGAEHAFEDMLGRRGANAEIRPRPRPRVSETNVESVYLGSHDTVGDLSHYFSAQIVPSAPSIFLKPYIDTDESVPKAIVLSCWGSQWVNSHDTCKLSNLVHILVSSKASLNSKSWILAKTALVSSSDHIQTLSGSWN